VTRRVTQPVVEDNLASGMNSASGHQQVMKMPCTGMPANGKFSREKSYPANTPPTSER